MKKIIIASIISAVIFSSITAFATTNYSSDVVLYKKGNENITLTSAIDELNDKIEGYDDGFKEGLKKGLEQAAGVKVASNVSSFSQDFSIPGVTLTTSNFSYRIVNTVPNSCGFTDPWGYYLTCSAPAAPAPNLTYSNGHLTLSNTTAYSTRENGGESCTARTTVYVDIYCNYSSSDVD